MMHFGSMTLDEAIAAVSNAVAAEDEERAREEASDLEYRHMTVKEGDRYPGQTEADLRTLQSWLEQARACKEALVATTKPCGSQRGTSDERLCLRPRRMRGDHVHTLDLERKSIRLQLLLARALRLQGHLAC